MVNLIAWRYAETLAITGDYPMSSETRIELAQMFDALPDSALVDERVLSAVLDTPIRTLQENRVHKVGVPYVKLGRSVRYKVQVVREFIDGAAA
jgi:hypothetical protein